MAFLCQLHILIQKWGTHKNTASAQSLLVQRVKVSANILESDLWTFQGTEEAVGVMGWKVAKKIQ